MHPAAESEPLKPSVPEGLSTLRALLLEEHGWPPCCQVLSLVTTSSKAHTMTNCSLKYSNCSKQRSPNGFTELITHHIISVLILILNSNSESPSHSSLGCGRSALSSLSCMCLRVHASAWGCTHVCPCGCKCVYTCLCLCLCLCACVHAPVCACACALCVCVCECSGEQNKVLLEQKLRAAPVGVGERVVCEVLGTRTPGSRWDWKGAELSSGLHAVSERGSLEAGLPGQEQALQQKSD